MFIGYRVKIYPDKIQKEQIFRFFDASRFAYNWTINLQNERLDNCEKLMSKTQIVKLWKDEKKKYPWVKEISGRAIRGGIFNALAAYDNARLKHSKRPGYKKKKNSIQSCRTNENRTLIEKNRIRFEKLGWIKSPKNNIPASWIHIDKHNKPDKGLCNPTLSYDGVDFWFSVSIDVDFHPQKNETQTEAIGIDLGIKNWAIDSEKINCSRPDLRKEKKKLKRLTKKASKYYKKMHDENQKMKTKFSDIQKSKNLLKLEIKINKVQKRMSNKLKTAIHEYTAKLVKRNPKAICIENLCVQDMMKNYIIRPYAREIMFYEFRRQLKYKCLRYNIPLIIADRYYASSKICNHCGNKKQFLSLRDRTYICEKCGYIEDRDYNACLNLRDLAYS